MRHLTRGAAVAGGAGMVRVTSTMAEADAIALAREDGARVLVRGDGTSQSGQTVNDALVIAGLPPWLRSWFRNAPNRRRSPWQIPEPTPSAGNA